MLGVDVEVEDDRHEKVQQAEKEHSLAHALQRAPQQSAHPAGGRRPARWARASGCRPEQGEGRNRPSRSGPDGQGYPPTPSAWCSPSQTCILTHYLLTPCDTHGLPFYLQRDTRTQSPATHYSHIVTHLSTNPCMHTFLILADTHAHKHNLMPPHTQGACPYRVTQHTPLCVLRNMNTWPLITVVHTSKWKHIYLQTHMCTCAPENRHPTGHHPQPRTLGLGRGDHLLSTYHAGALGTHDFSQSSQEPGGQWFGWTGTSDK